MIKNAATTKAASNTSPGLLLLFYITIGTLPYPALEDSIISPILHDLCKKKSVYIVAGTHHELEGELQGYSKCLLFNPYTEKPLIQLKNSPGRFKGDYEDIMTPNVRRVSIFHTHLGNFIIPICVDIKSRGLRDNLLVLNRSDKFFNPVDLVIVPSYTDDPVEIYDECEKLSNKTNTCVLFCNDASHKDLSSVFIHGEKSEPVKRRQRTHAASGGASEALPHEVGARPSRSEPKLNTHALYPSRSELRGITFKNQEYMFARFSDHSYILN